MPASYAKCVMRQCKIVSVINIYIYIYMLLMERKSTQKIIARKPNKSQQDRTKEWVRLKTKRESSDNATYYYYY